MRGWTGEINPPRPAPAELFTSPKPDSTSLYLLNLIALVREGQMGLGSQGERCAKGGWRFWGVVECHKATAVQGCLSLQGSTPLLSW